MEWVRATIPKVLGAEIQRIMARLGYVSMSAFVSEAVREHLERKRREFDEIEEIINVGRKTLGKDEA